MDWLPRRWRAPRRSPTRRRTCERSWRSAGRASTRRRTTARETKSGAGSSIRRRSKEGPTLALLSHRGYPAVPSPKRGLTSVFGMGTGVAPALWRVGKTAGRDALGQSNSFEGSRGIASSARPWVDGQAARAISTGQLHALLRFHLRPIDVLVLDGPSGDRSPGEISSWGGLPT